MAPPKCLAYVVILCFEKRRSKQNIVARLKSNNLATKNFGLATPLVVDHDDSLKVDFNRKGATDNWTQVDGNELGPLATLHWRIPIHFRLRCAS